MNLITLKLKPNFVIGLLILILFNAYLPAIYAVPIEIKNVAVQGSFPLIAPGKTATLVVDKADAEVVTIAATALSGDINLIINETTPRLLTDTKQAYCLELGL